MSEKVSGCSNSVADLENTVARFRDYAGFHREAWCRFFGTPGGKVSGVVFLVLALAFVFSEQVFRLMKDKMPPPSFVSEGWIAGGAFALFVLMMLWMVQLELATVARNARNYGIDCRGAWEAAKKMAFIRDEVFYVDQIKSKFDVTKLGLLRTYVTNRISDEKRTWSVPKLAVPGTIVALGYSLWGAYIGKARPDELAQLAKVWVVLSLLALAFEFSMRTIATLLTRTDRYEQLLSSIGMAEVRLGLDMARHEEQVKVVRGKIRRYSAEAQGTIHGSISFTTEELIEMSVVGEEERDACEEALAGCGELELWDGRYYVKGRAPKYGA
ncbi:MAG: hypothetical protein HY039_13225 [Nitrospirae bacterium]|nr:hypothetical protein [Nitrospirota bacterium]